MAEELRDRLAQILKTYDNREEALYALRALLTSSLRDGKKRETLLTQMETLRKSLSEEQEDILLEAMDFLVGWCSQHMKIEGE